MQTVSDGWVTRDLRDKVVVITGASSGLGRAAAIEFSRKGARVVLAARREDALRETAARCGGEGNGRALCVVTDVTREEDVDRLLETAKREMGGVDVWVNNAGVTLFAALDQAPFAEHRRVVETNLFGAMLCARAVMPVFREQGHGVLINVGSILSKIGQPYVPSYVISKFGLRGLSEALRTEFADQPNIHVCSIFPYAIDTPHFETGGNRIGRKARTMPPVQEPEDVARALVDLARRPRRERHVPRAAVLGLALHAIAPDTVERVLLQSLSAWHFGKQLEDKTSGGLYAPPAAEGSIAGHRRPRLGFGTLLGWIALRFVRIMVQPAQRPVG